MPREVSLPSLSTLTEALFVRARDTPDALAYAMPGDRLTWRTLLEGARQAASAFAHHRVGRGARCAIVLPTSADFIFALFGAQLVGAVPVAINSRLPLWQIRRRVEDVDCSLTIIRPETAGAAAVGDPRDGATTLDPADFRRFAPASPAALGKAGPDDLSHLQLTSGTSGAPRAAMILHRNVMASLDATHDVLRPVANDVIVGWLPLHHDFGLMRLLFSPLYSGLGCHLIEPSMAALPTWLETISRVNGTITAAPDFAFRFVARTVDAAKVRLGSLRVATSGGEPVRLTSIRMFEDHFGLPGIVRPGYGLAEATLGVSALRPGEPLRTDACGNVSCGRPLKHNAVRIVDGRGVTRAAGQRGRILVKGPTVFAGYWNDPTETAEVVRDGWLDTGDDGAMDGDDHLYVHGRSRAMIKRAGATIAPREIEEVADDVEGVRRSAAVGLAPDADSLTEAVFLVAEVERRLTDEDRYAVQEAIADRVRLAVGFPPRRVVLVSPGTIPRTPTGKIQYTELKRLLKDEAVTERPGDHA